MAVSIKAALDVYPHSAGALNPQASVASSSEHAKETTDPSPGLSTEGPQALLTNSQMPDKRQRSKNKSARGYEMPGKV